MHMCRTNTWGAVIQELVKRQSEMTTTNSQTQPTQSELAASEDKEEIHIHHLALLPL